MDVLAGEFGNKMFDDFDFDFDFESLGSVTSRMALYRKVSEQSFLLQHVWEDNTLAEQGFDASIV